MPRGGRQWDRRRRTDEACVWKKVQRARIKESPDGLSLPNQNTILINIKWYYFKRYGKKTIQLTKINMDLNNRKMTNDLFSPVGFPSKFKYKLNKLKSGICAFSNKIVRIIFWSILSKKILWSLSLVFLFVDQNQRVMFSFRFSSIRDLEVYRSNINLVGLCMDKDEF